MAIEMLPHVVVVTVWMLGIQADVPAAQRRYTPNEAMLHVYGAQHGGVSLVHRERNHVLEAKRA